jgi:hypothetical protein
MLHLFLRRRLAPAVIASAIVAASIFAGAAKAENLNRWVTIENRTGYTIVAFYGSHRDMTSWGRDHLGNDVLPTGYSLDINFSRDGSGYCIYDFRAEFDDGDVLEKYGVNVCKIGTYTYR